LFKLFVSHIANLYYAVRDSELVVDKAKPPTPVLELLYVTA